MSAIRVPIDQSLPYKTELETVKCDGCGRTPDVEVKIVPGGGPYGWVEVTFDDRMWARMTCKGLRSQDDFCQDCCGKMLSSVPPKAST